METIPFQQLRSTTPGSVRQRYARLFASGAFVLIALSTTLGCGGSSTQPPPRTLISVAVTPANASTPLGTTEQYKATGSYSDSTSADLTASASWTSSTQ